MLAFPLMGFQDTEPQPGGRVTFAFSSDWGVLDPAATAVTFARNIMQFIFDPLLRKIPETGEICTRGPHVMKGYFNKPEATAEAIDSEKWFHTGDIGELRDGYLAITDRLKDIIVTAGGKNIAAQPIENKLKTNKYVSQPVMIGDKRKYPVMLIVPNFDHLERWAARKNLIYTSRAQLIRMPEVIAKMQREMERVLSGLASFEMPKKVGLIEHEFSIDKGQISAKASVKRRVIDRDYKELIDSLYEAE